MPQFPQRYARLLSVDYETLEQLLNIPDGFRIDGMEHDISRHAFTFRIRCPQEDKYEVPAYLEILRVLPAFVDGTAGGTGIYWPDLDQQPPDDVWDPESKPTRQHWDSMLPHDKGPTSEVAVVGEYGLEHLAIELGTTPEKIQIVVKVTE